MASLEIDRLTLALHASAAAARAPGLQRRVQAAVERGVPRALDGLAQHDESIVFIDRLDFDAAVSTDWDDAAIARALAAALLRRLQLQLAGPGVRRFTDRAEWLAAFALALLDGRAWQNAWFRDLDGLRPLPASAALRTLLTDEREPAVTALLRLAPADRRRVLGALDAADQRRVLAAWYARAGAALPSATALWPQARALRGGLPELMVAALQVEAERPGTLAHALEVLAALADLAAAPAAASPPTLGASARQRLAQRCVAAGLSVQWLERLDEDDLATLADAIDPPAPCRTPAEDDAAPSLRTPHGGAFVLLVALGWTGRLGAWARAARAAGLDAAAADALVRALALATAACALRPDDPAAVFDDPALHGPLGLARARDSLQAHAAPVLQAAGPPVRLRPLRLGRALCSPALDRLLALAAAETLACLRERVPGCRQGAAGWLRANLLAPSAQVERDAAGACRVLLSRAPLHVLLLLAGLSTARLECGGVRIDLETERSA